MYVYNAIYKRKVAVAARYFAPGQAISRLTKPALSPFSSAYVPPRNNLLYVDLAKN